MEKLKEAQKLQRTVSFTCPAGLVEAIKPLISGNSCIGFVMIGQIRSKQKLLPDTDFLKSLSRTKLSEIKKEFYSVPYIREDEMADILKLLKFWWILLLFTV